MSDWSSQEIKPGTKVFLSDGRVLVVDKEEAASYSVGQDVLYGYKIIRPGGMGLEIVPVPWFLRAWYWLKEAAIVAAIGALLGLGLMVYVWSVVEFVR